MDYDFYLKNFESVSSGMGKNDFGDSGIHLFAGIVLDSVVMKAYKKEWAGDFKNPLTAESRIFFSVWVSDKAIKNRRLYYNIHALKLRQLKGYKVTSRNFAEQFRAQFVTQSEVWPNVSIKHGPLTLMEGWIELNRKTVQNDIADLIRRFIKLSPIIDATLNSYKIQG